MKAASCKPVPEIIHFSYAIRCSLRADRCSLIIHTIGNNYISVDLLTIHYSVLTFHYHIIELAY